MTDVTWLVTTLWEGPSAGPSCVHLLLTPRQELAASGWPLAWAAW